jgi:hypothetical protein|uniref:Uncharacterized protein n=1 Tax=Picea glauca TaxID=3330 RepID=A0A124GMD2_PICGL|nr:hypothetical protein ABT39_MTgene3518 [Picea glauca]
MHDIACDLIDRVYFYPPLAKERISIAHWLNKQVTLPMNHPGKGALLPINTFFHPPFT